MDRYARDDVMAVASLVQLSNPSLSSNTLEVEEPPSGATTEDAAWEKKERKRESDRRAARKRRESKHLDKYCAGCRLPYDQTTLLRYVDDEIKFLGRTEVPIVWQEGGQASRIAKRVRECIHGAARSGGVVVGKSSGRRLNGHTAELRLCEANDRDRVAIWIGVVGKQTRLRTKHLDGPAQPNGIGIVDGSRCIRNAVDSDRELLGDRKPSRVGGLNGNRRLTKRIIGQRQRQQIARDVRCDKSWIGVGHNRQRQRFPIGILKYIVQIDWRNLRIFVDNQIIDDADLLRRIVLRIDRRS